MRQNLRLRTSCARRTLKASTELPVTWTYGLSSWLITNCRLEENNNEKRVSHSNWKKTIDPPQKVSENRLPVTKKAYGRRRRLAQAEPWMLEKN